jgi:YidC/Oxa1 family membrane protein insertase
MDQQQRNLIIAIALSLAILFGFQFFFSHPHPVPQIAQQTAAPAGAGAPAAPTAAAPGLAAAAPTVATRAEALGKAPRVRIAAPSINGSLNLDGARLDDLTLVNYHETTDPKSPEIVLLAPDGTADPYFVQLGWTSDNPAAKMPGPDTAWTSTGGTLSADHPVELSWDNGAGLTFKERFSVNNDYMFHIDQIVENRSDKSVTVFPYARVARIGDVPVSSTYLLHEGPIGVLDGRLHDGSFGDKFNYANMKKDTDQSFNTTGGWLGFTDKYWLVALIPPQQTPVKASLRYSDANHTDIFQAEFIAPADAVAPGRSSSVDSRVFAGAKEVALLDHYESVDGISRFDRAIDFGLFYWITKPIFLTLDFFYHLIGNFGLAIMLLTVTIKLIFFPLANKSYRAMSKMKQLQPEMQKLRERFGDDKQRLNTEMMALYKRVGANPMAGCLPIVIQIPVFFSLYKVLYVTIEMRQAPFYGWIHDLSAPDPTSFVNLFGLLPYTPPDISFLHIGAWPLIMGCTMFLQQKLNPQPPDPMQAKMFMILPVVFTFMLSRFAAGLVIYWSWNNLLSVAQQWLIMRRAGITRANK